jgi:SNF2 family DNA or RNA helicase
MIMQQLKLYPIWLAIQDSSIFNDLECLDVFPKDFDGRQINHKDSGKLYVLVELLSKIRQHTKEKVVVVSNYTQTLDILEVMCDANDYLYYRLDGYIQKLNHVTLFFTLD